MKLKIFITIFFCINSLIFAKDMIAKDFDGDGKLDKIFIQKETKTIVYLLSTTNYKKQTSLPISDLRNDASLEETKRGFKFQNRVGETLFAAYFQYIKKENNFQVSGLRRSVTSENNMTESGDYGYRFSTNELSVKWNNLDKTTNKVVILPVYKTKLTLDLIYLDAFNDIFLKKFDQQCLSVYQSEMTKSK